MGTIFQPPNRLFRLLPSSNCTFRRRCFCHHQYCNVMPLSIRSHLQRVEKGTWSRSSSTGNSIFALFMVNQLPTQYRSSYVAHHEESKNTATGKALYGATLCSGSMPMGIVLSEASTFPCLQALTRFSGLPNPKFPAPYHMT